MTAAAAAEEFHLADALAALVNTGEYEIPVFPQVARRVLQLSADPTQGPLAIAKCLEKDPALCARVLATAGSAFYGGRTIRSIKQAVSLLGMNEIALVATTAALGAAMFGSREFAEILKTSWQQSVAAGILAREIARARRTNVDAAFLCGLLHGIGRPIALGLVGRLPASLECEQATLMQLCAPYETRLGCEAARAWGLPAAVECSIAYLDVELLPDENVDEIWTTRLARDLAAVVLTSSANDDGAWSGLAEHPALHPLSLYSEHLETIRAAAPRVLAALESLT